MTYPIIPGMDLSAFARDHRVRFVRKDASRLMRFLGWLLGLFGSKRFMDRAWTTIGRTVYYPTGGPEHAWWHPPSIEVYAALMAVLRKVGMPEPGWAGYAETNRPIIEHEYHHVIQFERLWHLHSLLYLVFPLPVLLSWYRWRCERVAYLHQLRHYARKVLQQAFVCTDSAVACAVWSQIPVEMTHDRFPIGRDLPPGPNDDAAEGFKPGDTWVSERVKYGPRMVDVVDTLWRSYGWCWPRKWMRQWFLKQLKKRPS